MDDIIIVSDISYRYSKAVGEDDVAVDHVSLNIKKGEFVAIVGHNGSGKSTLAKHLNALFVPEEGVVFIDGMNTADSKLTWNIRQTAGMVFQNPDNQLVTTIVEEDVAFGPENLGVPPAEIRQRVDAALKAVGMEAYAKGAPHLLSGGQKQRIAIAGVLAMKPKILVMDEPTAMLDPAGRREVMETVLALNRNEGITIVYITHFMEEALYADRLIVMNDGRIEMQGRPEEIFKDAEALRAIGLDVPEMAELALLLEKKGIKLSKPVFTVECMAEELCRLL